MRYVFVDEVDNSKVFDPTPRMEMWVEQLESLFRLMSAGTLDEATRKAVARSIVELQYGLVKIAATQGALVYMIVEGDKE